MEKAIADQIAKETRWLSSVGFTLKPHAEDLIYENSHIRISFSFYKSSNDQSLLIGIKKLGENKSFYLNELLEHLGESKLLYKPSENSVDFIHRCVEGLKSIAQSGLKKVLEGKEWIEVPRDYMSYK